MLDGRMGMQLSASLREGSDLKRSLADKGVPISIHAPAKGATAKITKTIPNDFCKINNYNNSFA